ncbi:MAG: efflux RND transporter periplasmic adaptor subunit, partial [Mucinivorans sp.]
MRFWLVAAAQQAKQSQSEYPILTLDTSSAVVYTDFATEIKSGTVVEIRPRVSGYIDKILVAEGAHISKGEAIFQINQDDLKEEYNMAQANVDAARAKLENAKLEVRKLTPLVEKGIISSYELDNANSNLTAANAALNASISQMNNAKISLSYARITSPVNGVVGR